MKKILLISLLSFCCTQQIYCSQISEKEKINKEFIEIMNEKNLIDKPEFQALDYQKQLDKIQSVHKKLLDLITPKIFIEYPDLYIKILEEQEKTLHIGINLIKKDEERNKFPEEMLSLKTMYENYKKNIILQKNKQNIVLLTKLEFFNTENQKNSDTRKDSNCFLS